MSRIVLAILVISSGLASQYGGGVAEWGVVGVGAKVERVLLSRYLPD